MAKEKERAHIEAERHTAEYQGLFYSWWNGRSAGDCRASGEAKSGSDGGEWVNRDDRVNE